MGRTLIVAEVGVNHDGSVDKALELVRVAGEANADVVKFQSFDPALVATETAPQAPYQKQRAGMTSQFEMLANLQLDEEAYQTIADECRRVGTEFLSTAFDAASLERLVAMGMQRIKIPSGELTNGPLILESARTGRDLIVSTGMATMGEIEEALAVIAWGRTHGSGHPSPAELREAWSHAAKCSTLGGHVTLLHCTTSYPCADEDVNLRAMGSMRDAFGLDVGYSDHTLGTAVSVAAVALGATVIEKHITLNRVDPGPDHAASIEPDELTSLVKQIRMVERAMGSGVKAPVPAELANAEVARRSIVAATTIREGERFTEANLAILRPAGGQSPMEYWSLLGTHAPRRYEAAELIDADD